MTLFVSRKLQTDLKKAGFQQNMTVSVPNNWVWYAHRVTVDRRKWIIAMEQNSRYAVLIPNVTKFELVNLESVLSQHIIEEARQLCGLSDNASVYLTEVVREFTEALYVDDQGLNRSVQAHITDVAHTIEYMHYSHGLSPHHPINAFSRYINHSLRKRQQDKDYFYPDEVWKKSLMVLLHKMTYSIEDKEQMH